MPTRACSRLLTAFLAYAALALGGPARAQCSKDIDCKGDRICVNGSCVEPPSRSAVQGAPRAGAAPDQDVVKSYLEKRVTNESQGALALETFQKTNGFEEGRTRFYVMEWQAQIRFLRQGWKPGDAIGGYWNDFQVLPAQGGFLSGSWLHFDQGAKLSLRGRCEMRPTEKGWRIEEFTIQSYQKLAVGGSEAQAVPPQTVAKPVADAKLRDVRETGWVDPSGLMWTKRDSGSGKIDWKEATDYCRELRVGGFTDWRLPSTDELVRICDPSLPGMPKIRSPLGLLQGALPTTPYVAGLPHGAWWVWSGTKEGRAADFLDFGDCRRGNSNVANRMDDFRVLCVRPSGR